VLSGDERYPLDSSFCGEPAGYGPLRYAAAADTMSNRRPIRLVSLLFAYAAILWGATSGLLLLLDVTVRTSALVGLFGLPAGLVWIFSGFPRFVVSERRPYASRMAVQLAAILLPLLSVPVVGTWLVSSPSVVPVALAVSWVLVWIACVVTAYLFRCPRCSGPYLRDGYCLKVFQMKCSTCGVGPRSAVA